jgi:hypothetical protein
VKLPDAAAKPENMDENRFYCAIGRIEYKLKNDTMIDELLLKALSSCKDSIPKKVIDEVGGRDDWEASLRVEIEKVFSAEKCSYIELITSVSQRISPEILGLSQRSEDKDTEFNEECIHKVGNFIVSVIAEETKIFLMAWESTQRLNWESKSVSFDNMRIESTRPGFGMIALLKPDKLAAHLRDKLQNMFLFKVRDKAMHMILFQVFVTFDKDYDPSSLPSNLLSEFKEFLIHRLSDSIRLIDQELPKLRINATDEFAILGRYGPTHLAIVVECREFDELTLDLKRKANEIGYRWMCMLSDELKSRSPCEILSRSDMGAVVKGVGWKLTLGYTPNKDYKTHVTLGMFPTGEKDCDDDLLLKLYRDVDREINLCFSGEEGSMGLGSLADRLSKLIVEVRNRKLQEMDLKEIEGYKKLYIQVENAKQGRPLSVGRVEIEEWGAFNRSRMQQKFQDCFASGGSTSLNLLRIVFTVINMDRIQNFELVD